MVSETEVTVRGRLGHHPELQRAASGTDWLRLRVATNRRVRTGDSWSDGPTSWYDVKLWGEAAQNAAESLRKGDPVIVQGSLQIEEYTNANGVTLRTAVIHANALGPDLRYVTARITRVTRGAEAEDGTASRSAPAIPVDVSRMQEVPDDVADLTDEPELEAELSRA